MTQPGQSERLAIAVNLLWLRPGKVGGGENYVIGLLAVLSEFSDALDLEIVASLAALFTERSGGVDGLFPGTALAEYQNRQPD